MTGPRGFFKPGHRNVEILRQMFVPGVVKFSEFVLRVALGNWIVMYSFVGERLNEFHGFSEIRFHPSTARIAITKIGAENWISALRSLAIVLKGFAGIGRHAMSIIVDYA